MEIDEKQNGFRGACFRRNREEIRNKEIEKIIKISLLIVFLFIFYHD